MLEYQDALFDGETLPGDRDCQQRWDIIRPHVPNQGMVLDVGSNLGYFALRSVGQSEGVAVVSLEHNDDIVERQRQVVASHSTDRICIIQGAFDAAVSGVWASTCDWFDLTLLLSILHWMDDPAAVLRDLSSMSAKVIIEVPDPNDEGACGQHKLKEWSDPRAWVEQTTGRRSTLIGQVKRHTSKWPSHIILVEGPVERTPSKPYWGSTYAHPQGNDYRLHYDGQQLHLTIRQQEVDYVPGVCLLNLMKLGRLVWPKEETLVDSGMAALQRAGTHLDPLPHNMLWTPHGLKLIDGDDIEGYGGPAFAEGLLKKSIRQWRQNKMVAENAYVPHGCWLVRKIKQWRRRILGHPVVLRPLQAIRRRLP